MDKAKAWSALNSGIVIWFLSSVVLAGLGWLREVRRERVQKEMRVARLDREIMVRLDFMCNVWWGSHVLRKTDSTSYQMHLVIDSARRAAMSAVGSPAQSNAPAGLYANFRETSLLSLIFELGELSPDSARPALDSALRGARILARELAVTGVNPSKKTHFTSTWFEEEPTWRDTLGRPHPFRLLNLRRWKAPLYSCTANADATAPAKSLLHPDR
jgi:hypothetical protein